MKKILIVILLLFFGCASSTLVNSIQSGMSLVDLKNIASKDNVIVETFAIYKGQTLYHCYRKTSLLKRQKSVRFYVITNNENKIVYMSRRGIRKHDRNFLIDFVDGDVAREKKEIELEIK